MKLSRQIVKELAFEAALFAVGAGEIAWCYTRPVLLTVLSALTALVAFAFWRRRDVVLVYVLGGIIGPCGEMIGVRAGAWAYAHPTFLGIPLWLPFAWGLAVVLIQGVAGTIAKVKGAP